MPFVYNPYSNTSTAGKKQSKNSEGTTTSTSTYHPIVNHHWDVATYSRTCVPTGRNVGSDFCPGPNSASVMARSINFGMPPMTQQLVTPMNKRPDTSPGQTNTLRSPKLSPSTEASDSDISSTCSFDYACNERAKTTPSTQEGHGEKGTASLTLKMALSDQAFDSLVNRVAVLATRKIVRGLNVTKEQEEDRERKRRKKSDN